MPLWRRCSVPRVLLSFIIRYSTNIVGHHTRYRTVFYTDHIKIANTNSNIDLRVSTMMRDTFLISNVHKIQPGQDTMQCYIWSWAWRFFFHWIFFNISILEFFLHRYSVTFGVGGWGGYCADWGGSTPSLLMLSILTSWQNTNTNTITNSNTIMNYEYNNLHLFVSICLKWNIHWWYFVIIIGRRI